MQIVVDENERMYTWGSSPQALRLANQIKRRANAKQKIEENQRREMSRRFEATIVSTAAPSTTTNDAESTASGNLSTTSNVIIPTVTISSAALDDADDSVTPSIVKDEIVSGVATIVADIDNLPLDEQAIATEDATNNINIEIINDDVVGDVPVLKSTSALSELSKLAKKCADVTDTTSTNTNVPAAPPTSSTQQPPVTVEIDPCEHMSPHLVDTSEVAGQILQVFC